MPFSPKSAASLIFTFSAVLIFTMIKEGFEDYARYKQDKAVNTAITHRYNKDIEEIESIECQQIKDGDIIEVRENEPFPCDLVFLASSNSKGVCFVNTMNLDGETNLKERIALDATQMYGTVKTIGDLKGELRCDLPNKSLVRWNCNIRIKGQPPMPMFMDQLLLRGCVLKNTEYIYGVAIYTGHQTKIMLNTDDAPSKMSNILKMMNRMLYLIFMVLAGICLVFAGFGLIWDRSEANRHVYLGIDAQPSIGTYFVKCLTFLVAYSHFIPISLYVSLEVVKLMLAWLIGQDLQMYYERDDKPAICRASDLVEELGQVEFVFSDKTGTLTCNEMELKKVAINNVTYGGGEKSEGVYSVGSDTTPDEILSDPDHPEYENITRFFQLLALCHAAFVSHSEDGHRSYQSSSPDEIALLEGAANMGFKFHERADGRVYIQNRHNQLIEWPVLAEIPFNSDRKRMSVIVRESSTGRLLLLTKGADSIMMNLLSISSDTTQLHQDLHSFAIDGLRTLVMGQRYLDPKEFETWFQGWNELLMSAYADKEERLMAHGEQLERNLELIGASAIEDKLQDGVPEAIELLIKADIRVWVLTGDKQETAIEIGKSCNLITPTTELIILSKDTEADYERKLNKWIERLDLDKYSVPYLRKQNLKEYAKLTLVINGLSLTWALDPAHPERRQRFFKLGLICQSCICCRVSPAQKSEVVRLARDQGDWLTLAIGDGANDVAMIQEAHIGVGISGREGTQAVQASDFALAQFRYLQRLLLVHGRWSYRRISWFICYYFYKNVTVVFTELSFAIFNGFSGQIYFLDWLPMLYNAVWTSWPCIIMFLFEQDVNDQISLEFPIIYAAGQRNLYFSFKRFMLWNAFGMWHGLVCFWIPIFSGLEGLSSAGGDYGLWCISTISFSLIIHVITFKMFLETGFWTSINMQVILRAIGYLSVVFYYLTILMLNFSFVSVHLQPQANQMVFNIIATPKVWIIILITPLLALIPDFFLASWNLLFKPTPVEHVKKYFGGVVAGETKEFMV